MEEDKKSKMDGLNERGNCTIKSNKTDGEKVSSKCRIKSNKLISYLVFVVALMEDMTTRQYLLHKGRCWV